MHHGLGGAQHRTKVSFNFTTLKYVSTKDFSSILSHHNYIVFFCRILLFRHSIWLFQRVWRCHLWAILVIHVFPSLVLLIDGSQTREKTCTFVKYAWRSSCFFLLVPPVLECEVKLSASFIASGVLWQSLEYICIYNFLRTSDTLRGTYTWTIIVNIKTKL